METSKNSSERPQNGDGRADVDNRDQESFSFVVASSHFFLFFFALGTPRGWSGWSGGRAGSQERRLPPLECLG